MSTHADKLKALLRNTTLYMLGLFFLTLAKAKHTLQGYTSSKPIPMKELEQCVAYDIEVVDQWLQYVNEYTDQSNYIIGKNVLELGPGSDLGAGLYLLSRGAFSHQAIDVNDLVGKCPKQLYELLFETLSATDKTTDINFLRQQLERQQHGKSDHLVFVNRADFDIAAAFQANTIDVVFSQAAFEHFDEIDRTINRLSTVVKSGGIAVIEIDLKLQFRQCAQREERRDCQSKRQRARG